MNRRNHPNIKAVIFDYGMVLCHPPTAEEIGHMASTFGVSTVRFYELWERNRGLYDRGDLTAETYWSRFAEDASVTFTPEQLRELCQLDVMMWAHENHAMVGWARRVRSLGLKTAILSNMHAGMISYARKNFAWLSDFDHLTFSAEVGFIKPAPEIYEHALRGVGVEAPEALFLDDREANIQAARALGIAAIQFRSRSQLRDDLRQLGFPVLPD